MDRLRVVCMKVCVCVDCVFLVRVCMCVAGVNAKGRQTDCFVCVCVYLSVCVFLLVCVCVDEIDIIKKMA